MSARGDRLRLQGRGFFEIGICNGKTPMNLGTLWRSAHQLGATGIFVIGQRYKGQASDTTKTYKHVPMRQYRDFADFQIGRPHGAVLVGVEMEGTPLQSFKHPSRAVYLLGSEDNGLPPAVRAACKSIVSIESTGLTSYNVAVAGSLVMYDRAIRRAA